MTKYYSSSYCSEATEIFLDIYSNPPFSFKWLSYENIYDYFRDFEKEFNFLGFVCEVDQRAVGFCFGSLISHFSRVKYRVNEIFITRGLQSRGIGSRFVSEIENMLGARSVEAIEISTDKRAAAYGFYKKLGFIESGNIVSMVKSVRGRH